MPKNLALWLLAPLCLAACGQVTSVPAEDPDAELSETTATRTFTFDAPPSGQVGRLAVPTPGAMTLELSVRRGNFTRPGTNQYVGGLKKAYVKFTFDSGVTLKGTYSLKLVEAREDMGEHPELVSQSGVATLRSLGKSLGRGTKTAPEPNGPACATLEYNLATVANTSTTWTAPATATDGPLMVCEGDADKGVAQAALTKATKGLLYMSESDRPWTWFQEAAGPTFTLPDVGSVAALVGETGQPAEEVPAADFRRRLTKSSDPTDPASVAVAKRYTTLFNTLRANYRSYRVYRVGAGPEIHIYILGVNSWGISGIQTVSIET